MIPTNVLIIDDSKMITKLTAKILLSNKISNYFFHEDHIYIAYDGMQAIEMLSKYPNISLLISDIMMPELNGHELIEILIDTGKIKTLDVIFITTPINTKIISKKISENIKGVIYKPFSAESFSDFFNNLEIEHERKIQNQKKIKSDHAKQIKYIRTWVQNYCDEDKIDIQPETLETLINSEFDHFYAIDADELYMTCQIVLENYIKSIDNSLVVNSLLMEKVYNIWRHPEKYKTLGMHENFHDIMLNTEAFSNSMSVKEHLKYSFILPLNRLLTKVRDMAKDKQKLLHDDFTPYLDKLLDTFLEIDSNYKNMEVLSILNHIKEIEKFQEELKPLLEKSNLIEKFVYLKDDQDILEDVEKHISTCIKYISQQIIPYYVFKANDLAWQNAKRSSKIVGYLKSNLKFKMINTHNLLHQRGIIDRNEIKKFQKYDKEKIVLATRDLETLEMFKKKLTLDMPPLEILIFKSVSILKNELEKHSYKRVVVDLSFANAIFDNGYLLVKLLNKKFQEFEKIVERGELYLLATPAQKEMLEKSKIKFKYKVFSKPLDNRKIFERFYLEN